MSFHSLTLPTRLEETSKSVPSSRYDSKEQVWSWHLRSKVNAWKEVTEMEWRDSKSGKWWGKREKQSPHESCSFQLTNKLLHSLVLQAFSHSGLSFDCKCWRALLHDWKKKPLERFESPQSLTKNTRCGVWNNYDRLVSLYHIWFSSLLMERQRARGWDLFLSSNLCANLKANLDHPLLPLHDCFPEMM